MNCANPFYRPSKPSRIRRHHETEHAASPQHHLRHQRLDTSDDRCQAPRCRRPPKDAPGSDSFHGCLSCNRGRNSSWIRKDWQPGDFHHINCLHLHLWLRLRSGIHFDAADLSWGSLVQRHASQRDGNLSAHCRMCGIREHIRGSSCSEKCTYLSSTHLTPCFALSAYFTCSRLDTGFTFSSSSGISSSLSSFTFSSLRRKEGLWKNLTRSSNRRIHVKPAPRR